MKGARKMNLRTLIASVAISALTPLAATAQADSYKDIQYPALAEFEIERPEIYELSNGMKVFLMEDHELPLIQATARIRSGGVHDPADRIGLAALTGGVQRTGGAAGKSGDELDDFLEARAASVETSIGANVGFASMDSLKGDFDDVFAVFRDVLRHPDFAEDKLEVARAQAKTGVARRNDNVGGIAQREYGRLIFGADSPLVSMTEYATLDAISRDDLVAWHGKYYHPNNILLGVVGDFDTREMKKKIEAVFGDWPAGPAADDGLVGFKGEREAGVFYIEKTDVTQANIKLGHLGITIDNPDYFAVEVLNHVLGASWSSRLLRSVRMEKGLAYSVGGSIGSSFDYPGILSITLQTKSETMAEAVDAVYDVVRGMLANPATAEELSDAKSSILNSFVFNYASKGQIIGQQMLYSYYGLPLDFLENYRDSIERVSAEDVSRAAERYLHPDDMTLLVVGKAEDFDRPMDTFGEVEVLDITIPEPQMAAVEATDEGRASGQEILASLAGAMGAPEGETVEATRIKEEIVLSMQGQSMQISQDVIMVYPDRIYTSTQTPMGEQVIVLDGDEGFMAMGGQSRPAAPEQVADQKEEFGRDIQYLVNHVDAEGLEALADGEDEVDGTACRVVAVTFMGASSRLCVDGDGRLLKKSYQSNHPFTGAPGQFEVIYSDYREFAGRQVPYKSVLKVDGSDLATSTVTTFEINPEVDTSIFERPAA